MVALLDVNVLVALLSPAHPHFQLASAWFHRAGIEAGWATCPITELGVIRVCAQLTPSRRPERTNGLLRELRMSFGSRYVWWPDTLPPGTMREVREAMSARQVPDRYLLGLARRYRARLVTFDRAIARAGGASVLCLLPDSSGPVSGGGHM